jgi:hypothetical protein
MTTKHITAGWSGGPYLRLKPATVISLAGLRGRNNGLRSLVLPWFYSSNTKIRFEWGLLEVFHVKGMRRKR